MKRIFCLITFISIVISASAFSIKGEYYLHKMKSFTETLCEKSNTYSAADWQVAYNEYNEITDNLDKYQCEYSEDDKKKISDYKLICLEMFMKNGVCKGARNVFRDGVNKLFDSIK